MILFTTIILINYVYQIIEIGFKAFNHRIYIILNTVGTRAELGVQGVQLHPQAEIDLLLMCAPPIFQAFRWHWGLSYDENACKERVRRGYRGKEGGTNKLYPGRTFQVGN